MSKKSLEIALVKAQALSKEHPEIEVKVMDKKGCKAICTSSNWIYRERVLEGYHTVATYKGGIAL